jgi:nucleoid-associated protein YgaU
MASLAPAQSGTLAKLKIEAWLDADYKNRWMDSSNPLTVGINPSGYSQSMSAIFTPDKAAGGKGKAKIFNRPGEVSLKLELMLDGTGAVPGASKKSVDQQIVELRRLAVQINAKTDSPHYLKLVWGTLLFKGRAQSMEVNCTLFNPDGTPLRAKINATFVGVNEDVDGRPSTASAPAGPTSVTVHNGDTLAALCDRLYGDSKYYIAVAMANGLTSFRDLKPGQTLVFPPRDAVKLATAG